jgi:pyruvate dehydrogenase E1 component alpha subunit
VDGGDAEAVWQAARELIVEARNGGGPGFLHAHCVHLKGHFLGDPLLRMTREPLRETRKRAGPLLHALTARKGTRLGERMEGIRTITNISQLARKQTGRQGDPVERLRQKLTADVDRLEQLEEQVEQEIRQHVEAALRPA